MRRTYVHPSGNPDAKLAVCGEQPGLNEIRAQPPRPFVGPAGHVLDDCLMLSKIPRQQLYLTNVIKDLDSPLSHYINLDEKGRYTIHPEGYLYIQELGDELRKLKLNVIVALGNIALLALTNRVGITKWRGSVLESTIVPGLKVVPTFHPSTILPPKLKLLNKPLICEDLQRARDESLFPEIRRLTRNIHIRPTYDFAKACLELAFEVGLRGQTISTDIEVINGEIDCFSVGWSVVDSICIPLRCQNGDYWTPEQEIELLLGIARIIEDEMISKVNANFIFDLQFYFRKYGIRPRGYVHCTQIAQKISFPDYPAGLDFVTAQHTDIPYYKADGKQWMKMQSGTWEQWWTYNGMDSIVPIDAFPKQLTILKQQGNLETYERQRRLIEPLLYMGERGIRVDVEGMMKYRDEQDTKLTSLATELNSVVGHEINYNSPAQLKDYFYKQCGLKPYKSRKTHEDTTDVNALKRIFRAGGKGSQAARLMLDIRSVSKRKSTYLNVGKVDPDGRYRSSYKPVGAETGRLSSGETIFGTGGNQQNWPHDLLRFFLFDEGFVGYSLDLSQIENRLVAYVGGVISQIEAFENGIDLHKLTASFVCGKPYDQISSEEGSSPIGDGRHSERDWGKKANHASNYDVQYKTFALVNEITESESFSILERIHRAYPQIRGGYQVLIQNMLKKNRTVTNLFGRSRFFLGPIFPDRNTPRSMCEDTYRQAYAQMAQSTCADKINEQGMEFIYYNQQWFRPVELLAQIHDAIVFQIPLNIPWIEHARMILLIKSSLETPLIWHEREIPTPVDLSIGLNMCKSEMKEFKSKKIPTSPEKLAELLEETYNEIRKIRRDSIYTSTCS